MTTYHLIVGKGAMRIKCSFQAHNMADALAKCVHFFNTATIIEAYAGNEKSVDGSAKTAFPELKGKPLFIQPKRSNPFADSPVLIAEEEADMMPVSVEQSQQ